MVITKESLFQQDRITAAEVASIDVSLFNDQAVYDWFFRMVTDPESSAALGDTVSFLTEFRKKVATFTKLGSPPSPLTQRYEQLVRYLEFTTLPFQPLPKIGELLRQHVLFALAWGIDLRDRLTLLYLYSLPDGEYVSGIRQTIRQSLKSNVERLGTNPISQGPGATVPSEVRHWLADYESSFPADQARGSVDEVGYLNQSGNVRPLSEVDRDTLLKLIQFYDFLIFPPLEEVAPRVTRLPEQPLPIPGTAPRPVSLRRTPPPAAPAAVPVPVPPAPAVRSIAPVPTPASAPRPKTAEGPSSLVDRYAFSNEDADKIWRAQNELLAEIGRGTLDVRAEFSGAVSSGNKLRAVGLVVVLAQTKDLDRAAQADGEFRESLGQQYGEPAAAALSRGAFSPAHAAAYLRFLFQGKLGFTEDDGAKLGAWIGNILGGEYTRIVYFDYKTGAFHWSPVKAANDELRLAI